MKLVLKKFIIDDAMLYLAPSSSLLQIVEIIWLRGFRARSLITQVCLHVLWRGPNLFIAADISIPSWY